MQGHSSSRCCRHRVSLVLVWWWWLPVGMTPLARVTTYPALPGQRHYSAGPRQNGGGQSSRAPGARSMCGRIPQPRPPGQVSHLAFTEPHAAVKTGDELFGVIPGRGAMVAETTLDQLGAGRVQIGQHARLSFVSFPVRDYGYVDGIVSDISSMSRDSLLHIRKALPNGLRTSYGITVHFQQRMLTTVEIVVGKASLFRRLLNGTRLLLDQH